MSGVAMIGFDTATPLLSVAATRPGTAAWETVVEPGERGRPRHATALLAAIEAAADAAGGWPEVGALAVGVGPGTFTGLRIGIATARALAQARPVRLHAVGSVAALAAGAPPHDGHLLAALDARRGEVFAELRDPDGRVLWGPEALAPEALAERLTPLPGAVLALGDGSLRFRAQLETLGAAVPPDDSSHHAITGTAVCALASRSAPLAPTELRPNYLRRPDAELWRERQARTR